jgi:hypothetical protein
VLFFLFFFFLFLFSLLSFRFSILVLDLFADPCGRTVQCCVSQHATPARPPLPPSGRASPYAYRVNSAEIRAAESTRRPETPAAEAASSSHIDPRRKFLMSQLYEGTVPPTGRVDTVE